MLSSLLGIACMIAESMPASSPASETLRLLTREMPGCAPNTSNVRPTRI
jgi:hypothetical protein